MARYNHFAPCPYKTIMFSELKIGDEFRRGKYKGKRHSYVIAVKIGELSYMDKRSKEAHTLFSADNLEVYQLT